MDHSGACVHATQVSEPADPFRLESGRDSENSVKHFADSVGMSEPLQERRPSIDRRMSVSLRRLEVLIP